MSNPTKTGPKGFINNDKLETCLEELQDLLFNQLKLNPLERDIVLKIALRQEAKMQQSKEMKTGIDASRAAAEGLMKKVGLL